MIITEVEATIALGEMVQDATCPGLTDAEISDILRRFKRGALWAAATVYQLGDRIIPTLANRNGHRYVAAEYTAAGSDQKTGSTEPNWTTWWDGRTTDNHIIWQEDGTDWDAVLWDLSGAAQAAWLAKAGKATIGIDAQVGDVRKSASQLFEHCIAMARQYQRNYVA